MAPRQARTPSPVPRTHVSADPRRKRWGGQDVQNTVSNATQCYSSEMVFVLYLHISFQSNFKAHLIDSIAYLLPEFKPTYVTKDNISDQCLEAL